MDEPKYPTATSSGNSSSSKKKWILGTLIVLILAGIGGGIAAWQIIKRNNESSSSSSVSSTSKNGGSTSGVSGNPANFKKDSNLKQSFYAMAYSPSGSILPTCGANLADVQRDIQLLSQLTTRIRTYGSDCNASTLVMQAIEDTKVDMTVWLGIYIDSDDTIWERQRDDTLAIIQKYGTDHISGVTVGNEFLLNTEGAASSYTSIRQKVAEFKSELAKLNLDKTIPVGTADAGSMITASLASNVDYVMANVHPWFGGVPVDEAAGWTWNWQEENVVSKAGNTPAYIAETGWPTQSMTRANATLGGAVAGISQLQTFLDTYVCQANANQSAYFYFEPFDEPWKEVYGGVEPYWGLFDKDRNLKQITIPDCPPGNY
ncbi:glycoside hydrolase family 17 protein [Cystobasidium minutum MCA 4210]|uniref:glycoside hydrolase family 17 protein n=1 Tax=Cystobasidium minutum MCA 4210 TaxID=1397322 RepID=UPI0034CE1893|eukprot:jgi/Rhomi1/145482/e_gw1.5.467.1